MATGDLAAFRKLVVLLWLLSVSVPAVSGALGADPSIAVDYEGKVIPFSTSSTINVFGTLPPFTVQLTFTPPYGQPQVVSTITQSLGFFTTTFTPATLSPPPTPSPNGFGLLITDIIGRTASTTGYFGIASAAAGGTGDPLFVNWSGEAYEFIGANNATFNLLSTRDHNLNVHLVGANLSCKADGGTLMDAFGLKLNNNTVEVSINEVGNVTVVLDDDLVITREDLNRSVDHKIEADLGKDAMVQVELFREYHGHTVQIFTPIIHLVIYPTMPGTDSYYTEFLQAHLNFDMHLRDPSVSGIHGIIGQTAPNSYVNTKRRMLLESALGAAGTSSARFTGQGTEDWYRTTSLFAHDNKLNQFGKEEPPAAETAGTSRVPSWRRPLHWLLSWFHSSPDPGPRLAEVAENDSEPQSRRRLLSVAEDDYASDVITQPRRRLLSVVVHNTASGVITASGRQHL